MLRFITFYKNTFASAGIAMIPMAVRKKGSGSLDVYVYATTDIAATDFTLDHTGS